MIEVLIIVSLALTLILCVGRAIFVERSLKKELGRLRGRFNAVCAINTWLCAELYAEHADNYITGMGQVLGHVHSSDQCAGRACVIHNPSDHSMRGFPTNWRGDRGIMERICPHGVGHPDPDDLAYLESIGRKGEGVHGCDGCCS